MKSLFRLLFVFCLIAGSISLFTTCSESSGSATSGTNDDTGGDGDDNGNGDGDGNGNGGGDGDGDSGITLVTVIGSVTAGTAFDSLTVGDPVANADIFAQGAATGDIIQTDSSGNFEYEIELTGSLASKVGKLDEQESGSNLRIFAWKTVSASERFGTATEATLDAETVDLGELSLNWTTAARFNLKIQGDASCTTVVSVQVVGLPLDPINNTPGNCFVQIDYLPYNEDFTVELSATGFQTTTFDFTADAGGAAPTGSSNWTFINAADVPELQP